MGLKLQKIIEAEEAWKAIPGYEALYEISSRGRIRSLKRTNVRQTQILTQSPQVCLSRRYLYVCRNGDRRIRSQTRVFQVSTLIAKVFGPASATRCDHSRAKLSREQVERIKLRLDQGIKPKGIAIEFEVTVSTVSRIKHGKTWSSLKKISCAP